MQIFLLEKIDLLSPKQIEECLINVADTVMHCADNQVPVEDVIRMVRSSLHAQMEEVLRASLRELDQNRAAAIPPWMQQTGEEKPHARYQTQARKSL